MATSYVVSMLDGTKHTVALIADVTLLTAQQVAISVGDTIGTIKTGPINVAVTNIRRAIEEGTVTAPGTIPLFGIKPDVVNIADANLTADDNISVTVGADVLPKSVSTQFRERLEDITNAYTEGLV